MHGATKAAQRKNIYSHDNGKPTNEDECGVVNQPKCKLLITVNHAACDNSDLI